MPSADIKKLPVGTTRSAVEDFRKKFFYKRKTENEESKLHGQSANDVLLEIENERSKVQLEINKLIFAIEDEGVPMTDAEVQETNDEINRKLQLKYSIENDIFKITRGARDYIPTELKGNLSEYRFFGRAKKFSSIEADEILKARQGGSAVTSGLVKLGGSRESRNFQVEEAIEKALKDKPIRQKRKRNLFDVSSSDESET